MPEIENAGNVGFDQWPKSFQEIATRLDAMAAEQVFAQIPPRAAPS